MRPVFDARNLREAREECKTSGRGCTSPRGRSVAFYSAAGRWYGWDMASSGPQTEDLSRADVGIVYALPQEAGDDREGFIDGIIGNLKVIREHDLAEFVDVFCEEGVFDLNETQRIVEAAKDLGFVPRLHADEMASIGGAGLGVKMQAASVDHLMAISDEDVRALADSGTVANLLPATSFYLNKPYADARKLIDAGVAVSIASDYNPGSSPSDNFQFTMQLAGIKLRMTPEEILTASTLNPAHHLGIAGSRGSIEVGKQADICLSEAHDLAHMVQRFAVNLTTDVFINGQHIVNDRQLKEELK